MQMATMVSRMSLAVSVCGAALLASPVLGSDLDIQLSVARANVLIGEPLLAVISLRGTRPVMIDTDPTNDQNRLLLLIDRGAGFVPHQSPTFGYTQREPLEPAPLPPNGLVVEYLLAYDRGTRDWMFPAAGQYRLAAEYREPGMAPVRSQVATISVEAPSGEEATVFSELTRLDRITLAASGRVPALLEIAERYPRSVYLQHARLAALENRISSLWDGYDPEDPIAKPEGTDREAIEAFARRRVVTLLPDLHDLVSASGQFEPQALHLLAGAQEASGDAAAARETYERILRDHPNRSIAALAREALGDETAPVLTLSPSPTRLWPPNKRMVTVSVTISVTDDMDQSPTVTLVSITCDDACDQAQDVAGATIGTDDRSFQLRATRRGGGTGRTYAITYSATDDAGNETTAQTTVRVPHDQGM